MYSLTTRQRRILQALESATSPCSARDLAEDLGVCERTVRYDIEAIDRWLSERGVRLCRQPSRGFWLDGEQRLVASESPRQVVQAQFPDAVFSQEERLPVILCDLLLSSAAVAAKEVAERLGVSTATVYHDLDRVEQLLGTWNLALLRQPRRGLEVLGDESSRRQAIVETVADWATRFLRNALEDLLVEPDRGGRQHMSVSPMNQFLNGDDARTLQTLLRDAEEAFGFALADVSYLSLLAYMVVAVRRLRTGHAVDFPPGQLAQVKELPGFQVAQVLFSRVSDVFQIAVPENEVCHLALRLSTARQVGSNQTPDAAPGVDKDDGRYLVAAHAIVHGAAAYLGETLLEDIDLVRALALHLSSCVPRLRHRLGTENPLLPDLKATYPQLLRIAARVVEPLEKAMGVRFSDGDLGYVAMHLGASLERAGVPVRERPTVLVVCGEGLANSRFLLARLSRLFPEAEFLGPHRVAHVRAFLAEQKVDLLVSTVPLQEASEHMVVVHTLPTAEDIRRIKERLRQVPASGVNAAQPAGPDLSSLLPVTSIHTGVRVRDWHAAIEEAGNLLVAVGAVEPRYVQAMIRAVDEHGPYIVIYPGVALAHALPEEGSLSLAFSLIILDPPVLFGNEENDPIRAVFALAAVDGESHLAAIEDLMELLDDFERYASLLAAQDATEAARVIKGRDNRLDESVLQAVGPLRSVSNQNPRGGGQLGGSGPESRRPPRKRPNRSPGL